MAPGHDNAAAPSPGGESVASSKREASSAASPDGSVAGFSSKKKKMGPGSRGVANLTPDQLAKKRANDREAQRAIRERTKNQIETLEHRIQELTSQQPYQELQAVIHSRELVEQENAEIKRRLAGIVSMLQPIINSPPAESAYVSPAQTHAQTHSLPTHSQHAPASVHSAPTPTSTASPGSQDNSHSNAWPNSGEQAKLLVQQRHNMQHGLEMGPEKLGLDFVLDHGHRVHRLQTGPNGPQDTPNYHHIAMKHDWTATSNEQALRSRSSTAGNADNGVNPWYGVPSRGEHSARPPVLETDGLAGYSAPVKNFAATCPLDHLLLDFMAERSQRVAEGLPPTEVVGPRYPSVSSLLNPSKSRWSHPLSKVFTDILATFPDLSSVPERVAVLYIMFLIMRWQVAPTPENYDRLPEWIRPRPTQIFTAHPAWIDHVPFPLMREKLIRDYHPQKYIFDNFFIPFTTTLTLSWPYEDIDAVMQVPGSEELLINPVFERHLRNLDNWKLGEAFAKAFPDLTDTGNFSCKVPAASIL